MLRVACVKWGTKYGDEYAVKLHQMVERYLTVPHEFVCYTERPVDGVPCQPLLLDAERFPGWWQKVGIFSLEGETLFLDLDLVVVGELDGIVDFGRKREFVGWKDPWHAGINSSVFYTRDVPKTRKVFERFMLDPESVMNRLHGDQDWINETLPGAATWPSTAVVSFKAHLEKSEESPAVPEKCRVVVFHGNPKPHQCGGWVAEKWGVEPVDYLDLHRRAHEDTDRWRGDTFLLYLTEIDRMKREYSCESVLDYGCGKAEFHPAGWYITGYDPCLPDQYDEGESLVFASWCDIAPMPYDLVVCTDVLEHIPEGPELDEAIGRIFGSARKCVFLAVCCRPSELKLAGGHDAHATVRPREWWERKLFAACGGTPFRLHFTR